jgi:hypothetical protein
VEEVVGRAQKVSAKRESDTIGQEFGCWEEGVGWSYRSATEDKLFQPHVQEYGVFSLIDSTSLLVFLDVSCPAADVVCIHSIFSFSAINVAFIDG